MNYIRLFRILIAFEQAENTEATTSQLQLLTVEIRARELDFHGNLPLIAVKKALSLSECEYFCVCLSLSCELDGNLRNDVQAYTGTPIPTFDLACGLYMRQNPTESPVKVLLITSRRNSKLRFLFKESGGTGLSMLASMLLRENIMEFMLTNQVHSCNHYHVLRDDPRAFLPLFADLIRLISDTLLEGKCTSFCITGQTESGKRSLVRQVCSVLALPCIMISCSEIGDMTVEDVMTLSYELSADSALSGGIICAYDYTAGCQNKLRLLLKELPVGTSLFVLSIGDENAAISPFGRTTFQIKIGVLSSEDYRIAQEEFCAQNGICGENFAEYFSLTIGALKSAWAGASLLCKEKGHKEITFYDFSMAIRRLNCKLSLARSVDNDTELSDLVVEASTADTLEMLCSLARNGRKNSKKRLIALFYGASGTGKTMAASAVANALGMELLKVDLSRIMDKYIGETEKHISEIFAAARERNCILFFDEADALFSKRTQVESSHDRYANMETSFLLQSIEEYDGLILLATNLFGNFDEAFLRRIHILVHFSMPNAAQRLQLFRMAFAGLELSAGIDLEQLSEELELSPAAIVSVAEMAAALGKGGVSGAGFRLALENEMLKSGRPMPFMQGCQP